MTASYLFFFFLFLGDSTVFPQTFSLTEELDNDVTKGLDDGGTEEPDRALLLARVL